MPTPTPNEKRSDFIKRCIPQVIRDGTTNDTEQAAAICFELWRKKNDGRGKKDK